MKKFISGLLFGIIISVSVSVGANNEILAKFAQFNFIVDGKEKSVEQSPIVINGSSYLPVRSIANMLGFDVTYKADSRTIEFTNTSKQINTDNENISPTDQKPSQPINNDNSSSNIEKIKFKNLDAVVIDGLIYFDTKQYLDYIESLSPKNEIKYDQIKNLLIIKINEQEIEVPIDKGTIVHEGKRYINEKYYRE